MFPNLIRSFVWKIHIRPGFNTRISSGVRWSICAQKASLSSLCPKSSTAATYSYCVPYGGDDQDAAYLGESKLIVERTKKDKFFGPRSLQDLAAIYATVGRADDAIDLLEQLLDTVYVERITPHMLKIDPVWDPIRDNPRFQALIPRNI